MSRKSTRILSKREIEDLANALPSQSTNKLVSGDHRHLAEIYGANETRGLTRWARRRVMEYAR